MKLRAVIARYAKEHGIRIVRRAKVLRKGHDVDAEPSASSDDPKTILETLNRDVLYLESDEIDITAEILKRMNAAWAESRR